MAAWVIENELKILNLLGLGKNPVIRFRHELAQSFCLVTLII